MREIGRVIHDFAGREAFDIAWSRPHGEFGLTRPSSHEGLFEQVWVNLAGSRQEAVTTYAAVSVVWGRGTKGLVELEVVPELATVPGRGYAAVDTPDDLHRWAHALERYLPRQVSALAEAKGATLLEATRTERESAAAVAAALPESARLDEIRRSAEKQSAREDREAALRLADVPGVVGSADERELYEAAALLIAGAAEFVPGTANVLRANLLTEQKAMWQVQLVADILRRRIQEGRETPAPPVSG